MAQRFKKNIPHKDHQVADEAFLSFGRHLKSVRFEKGIRLEEVASETRVSLEILRAIEDENFDKLPTDVFVKGFLRAYAKTVGANGDDAVNRFISDLKVHKETEKQNINAFKTARRFRRALTVSLGTLGCIIVLAVFLSSSPPNTTLTAVEAKQPLPEPDKSQSDEKKTEPSTAQHPPKPAVQKQLLKIEAVKETWMKVVIDRQITRQFRLTPGEQLALEADYGFNLLVGDAKGVRMTLGDNPVRISGKDGQVVTVQIP